MTADVTARLYLLCGLPFSGKSTLARELARRCDVVHVELDQINAERGIGLDGTPIPPAAWAAAYREAYTRLKAELRAGRPVVFDATNYTRAQRDVLRRIARQADASAFVLYVDTPVAVAVDRWRANRQSRGRPDVRDDDFNSVLTRFEPPGADEDVFRYTGDLPLADWLEQLPR